MLDVAGYCHQLCLRVVSSLRCNARYWSEISNFSYPTRICAPFRVTSWNFIKNCDVTTRVCGLPFSVDWLMTGSVIWINSQVRQTDRRTKRHPSHLSRRNYVPRLAGCMAFVLCVCVCVCVFGVRTDNRCEYFRGPGLQSSGARQQAILPLFVT